ncbi:PaaI family thioesterase [Nocardioides panacisoli]|uniref:PaaI family thioesterase n=1 Tax=Nocardioides panacisoli TaxID=627624 RepID=UPI001C62770A|nr:PaaI family thioesterase [Nocardioides panacisoli]QYJ04531.1 PaaI family thioesterase [Nocardioides panacisoli]
MTDAQQGAAGTDRVDPVDRLLDTGEPASALDAWIRSMARPEPTSLGRLPSHSPTCAGCGKENPAGLALEVDATEAGVSAVHRFDRRQEGAPGITHGGLVAAAFDDLFGFLLYRVGELAVTRSLTVEYLRPVLLGVDYEFTARVREQAGRRLQVDAWATQIGGQRVATAHATFVIVDVEHFQQGSPTTSD